jgi:hypothetical protein
LPEPATPGVMIERGRHSAVRKAESEPGRHAGGSRHRFAFFAPV